MNLLVFVTVNYWKFITIRSKNCINWNRQFLYFISRKSDQLTNQSNSKNSNRKQWYSYCQPGRVYSRTNRKRFEKKKLRVRK